MLTLFFALIALLSNSAQAERPLVPRDHVYTIGGDATYYNSSSNFRTDGSSHGLLSGASFQNTQAEVQVSYEWARLWRFYTSLSYAETDATDGVVSRSNNGIDEFGAGAQFWLKPGPFYIVPQVQAVYPFTRMDSTTDSALLSDGALRLEAGAWGIWRFSLFQPFAYGGYVQRDSGRSNLLNYRLGAYWRPGRFWVQGEYRGFTSISHDADNDNRGLRDVYLTRVSGGSYRFDSINPTLDEAAVELGFRFTHAWNVYAGYALALDGNDAANGWTATVGLQYSGLLGRSKQGSAPEETPVDNSGQFRPANEKYDESLFIEDKSGTGKVKPRVRTTPSVDKLLNETEKELNVEEPER